MLFAEAAESAELPDLVLPELHAQLLIKLLFGFRHVVEQVIRAEPLVWHFVYQERKRAVDGELQGGAPDHGDHHVIPSRGAEGEIGRIFSLNSTV